MTESTSSAPAPEKHFDASSMFIEDNASFDVEIVNPVTSVPIGAVITVVSRESEDVQAVYRKQVNRRFRNASRRRGVSLTSEEVEAEALELLVACTKSWTGMYWPDVKGGELIERPCTPENVREIYRRAPPIREQVEEAAGNRENFTQR